MNTTLICLDTKNKCRVVELSLEKKENPEQYILKKRTGIYGGKFICQPPHVISKGKVKRTIFEQAILEYNSALKKYLDKGYKEIFQFGLTELTEDPSKFLGSVTDTKGIPKPMLAKHYKDVPNFKWDKNWLASYKYDGTRALLFQKDGKIQTSSRGGQNYNVAAHYIMSDSRVKEIFQTHPDIILDGELYIHGKPLSYISGLCRLETLDDKHKELEFHCYDVVRPDLDFGKRKIIMDILIPNTPSDSKIKFVKHYPISGYDNVMKLHQQAISEGYEGLILRDPMQTYKPGSRNRMFKVKEFQDDEFVITGITNGLRDEDFVFNLLTHDNKPFEAKPKGTREQRQEYRDNINSLIGKKGTVKYFGYTPDGIPNLPVFINVRYENDM